MSQIFLLLLALVAGLMLPLQAGLNSEMGRVLKSPVYASIVSFVTGLLALVAYGLVTSLRWSDLRATVVLPWYYWLGGVLGAVYVYGLIVLTPRLGVALTFGLTVAAQMTFSLLLDHYGWLGVPVAPVNWLRVLGVALIIGGVVIIRNY